MFRISISRFSTRRQRCNSSKIIADVRTTRSRFGGGLPGRPDVPSPPETLHRTKAGISRSCSEPMANIRNSRSQTPAALKTWPKLDSHFNRQREAFYHAESLRVFARDSVPPGTFQTLQDDIHSGVVDVCDSDHADGFERVKRVTQAARELQLTANALLACTKPKDRDGICHQLANEDRLIWTKS